VDNIRNIKYLHTKLGNCILIGVHIYRKRVPCDFVYSKPDAKADFAKPDSIKRAEINADSYLPKVGNSILCGLPDTL
jgi:hypothetical protein